ncbi:MAG: hypothetical protein L3J00_02425 [Thiomicrorhabdus sp.]|nr:hypothetical protein [Thiomicrorhabdus sp.]
MKKLNLPSKNSKLWSLLDQGLVSASNFCIGILLARGLGIEDFGIYVVGLALLLYANTFLQSLVVAQMMSILPPVERIRYKSFLVRGYFGYALLVSLAASILVYLFTFLIGYFSEELSLRSLHLIIGVTVFGFMIQDWLRRYLYATSNPRAVLIIDIVAYGGQFVCLFVLFWNEQLSVERAFMVYFITFFLTAVLTIYFLRLRPNFGYSRRLLVKYWRVNRDYLYSWQLQWLGGSGVILVGAGMIGAQAAAAIKAIQNLLGPINVFFQWMDNVIIVQTSLKFEKYGYKKMTVYLKKMALLGTLALMLFIVVLVFFSEWLIVFFYGSEYRVFAYLIIFQGVYYLFMYLYRIGSFYYRVLGSVATLAVSSFWWALVSIMVAMVTVSSLHEAGIMLALISGVVAGLIVLFIKQKNLARAHS